MDKKRNIFVIILLSLVSPFSLLLFFSGVVSLVASYFLGSGFITPVITLVCWLIVSGIYAFLDISNVSFKTSDVNKALTNHAKMVGVIALLLIPFTVVSSLLYHLEIPNIVNACATLFLLGLPVGIIPLLIFVREDLDSPLVARKIENMLGVFFPVFIGEVAITVFLTVFKFGYAFNPVELLILHFVLYFLLYLASFIISRKNKIELEVRRVFKFDKLFLTLVGVVFSFALVGGFFIIASNSLREYSLSFSFDNISTVLFLDNIQYNNIQEMLFFIAGYALVFLSYGSNMIKPLRKKIDIAGLLTLLGGAIIVFFLIKIPYIPGLIMNGELTFSNLSLGVILAFAPVFAYLIFEIINLRLALKELEKE